VSESLCELFALNFSLRNSKLFIEESERAISKQNFGLLKAQRRLVQVVRISCVL
jgi:hypothetical protein